MERILLKISGESIANSKDLVDAKCLNEIIKQIKVLSKQYQIAIVIGGGNIWRGAKDNNLSISRNISDSIGMIATTINATILCELLNQNNVATKVFSSHACYNLTSPINYQDINLWLQSGGVVIFSGGTGNPYFTTDTGAALRAAEINAHWIIMGKNGVDGIFSDDPKKNPGAKFFERLSYDEIIENKLKVMDTTALSICRENKIKIKVFNAAKENGYVDAINNKIKLTIVE